MCELIISSYRDIPIIEIRTICRCSFIDENFWLTQSLGLTNQLHKILENAPFDEEYQGVHLFCFFAIFFYHSKVNFYT